MLDKIKFGVFLPFYAFRTEKRASQLFNRLQDVVLECERLGYDSVWLDDHLMLNKMPILECWTTLSALSQVTETNTVRHDGNLQLLQEPRVTRQNGCNRRQHIKWTARARHWSRSPEERTQCLWVLFSIIES